MINDKVNHPSHYGGADNPYEAIKVIEAWCLCFCTGNAVKYISRAGKKNTESEIDDLEKAAWYINRKISQLKKMREDSSEPSPCNGSAACCDAPRTLLNEVAEAIGAASMCWNPRPGNQVFDSTLATKIVDELMQKIESDMPNAVKALKNTFADRSQNSVFETWKANIAMSFIDAWNAKLGRNTYIMENTLHEVANLAAFNFLNLLTRV